MQRLEAFENTDLKRQSYQNDGNRQETVTTRSEVKQVNWDTHT